MEGKAQQSSFTTIQHPALYIQEDRAGSAGSLRYQNAARLFDDEPPA
jgi:hypothetical protein